MPSRSLKNIRVLFLGAGGVGKTSVIRRLIGEDFEEEYAPTVYDIYNKPMFGNKIAFSLELIDTSGHYNFPAMLDLVVAKADILIFMYSVVDEASIQFMYQLKSRVVETRGFYPMETPMVVVANKVDDTDDTDCLTLRNRALSLENEFINWGTSFLATSAKLGYGIRDLLNFLRDEGECCTRLKGMSPGNLPQTIHEGNDDVFDDEFNASSVKVRRRFSSSLKRGLSTIAKASTSPIRSVSKSLTRTVSKRARTRNSQSPMQNRRSDSSSKIFAQLGEL